MAWGFRSGTQPVRTNSQWQLWFKLAAKVVTGNNAPKPTNTMRQLREKTLRSLNNG